MWHLGANFWQRGAIIPVAFDVMPQPAPTSHFGKRKLQPNGCSAIVDDLAIDDFLLREREGHVDRTCAKFRNQLSSS